MHVNATFLLSYIQMPGLPFAKVIYTFKTKFFACLKTFFSRLFIHGRSCKTPCL